MKKIIILLGIAIVLSLSSCNKISPNIERSENELETQKNTKLILVIDEWAPYTSENLEGYGIVSKIVDLAMKEAGLEYEIQFKPWSRTLEMVRYGDAWGSFPWFYTKEREEFYYYSQPIMTSNTLIFYKKINSVIENTDIEINSLDDLKQYKFGGVFGYFYEPSFKDSEKKFKYDLSSDLESAFRVLDNGKVDIICEEEVVGWHTISSIFPGREDEFGTFKHELSEEEFHLIVTKKDRFAAQKIEKFNKGLNKLKQSGEYEKILKEYNYN